MANYFDGKHVFGMVKVGERGQIVIPKTVREVFGIKAGDMLMVLGDDSTGLALITNQQMNQFFSTLRAGIPPEIHEVKQINELTDKESVSQGGRE